MHFNCSLDSVSHLSSGLIGVALVVGVFWLLVLISALSRQDFDPVTRFMWVFVIIATSVLGAVVYLVVAPARPQVEARPAAYLGTPSTCAACHATIPAGSSVCPKCGWTYDVAKPA
jgi:hypothetical protein